MIELFPSLGEFSYQKMLAVTIMKGVNKFIVDNGYMPITVRETQNECAMIESTWGVFLNNKHATIYLLNDFNQITHVAGSHTGYFPGGQSFENRMCVVHKHLKGYGGVVDYSQMIIHYPL